MKFANLALLTLCPLIISCVGDQVSHTPPSNDTLSELELCNALQEADEIFQNFNGTRIDIATKFERMDVDCARRSVDIRKSVLISEKLLVDDAKERRQEDMNYLICSFPEARRAVLSGWRIAEILKFADGAKYISIADCALMVGQTQLTDDDYCKRSLSYARHVNTDKDRGGNGELSEGADISCETKTMYFRKRMRRMISEPIDQFLALTGRMYTEFACDPVGRTQVENGWKIYEDITFPDGANYMREITCD